MPRVGKLKDGDLQIAGELKERLPAVTNGLVKYFPMDETANGKDTNPILDYSIWKDGQSGKVGLFGIYSSAVNNTRVNGLDPWGKPTVLWKCTGGNSGIYCDPVPIDNTKLYRFTWWMNRKVNGDGRFYAGCNGYGTVNGVMNLSGTYNTNPYFWNSQQTPTAAELPENEWVLVVGHIFPHTHTGTQQHPQSGRYTLNGKYANNSVDFKWAPETTTARGRTLSIYQGTATNIEHYHSYMRMEICDGTEPSIQDLLIGEANMFKPLTQNNVSYSSEGAAVEDASNNVFINHGQQTTPVSGDGAPPLRAVDERIQFRGRKVTRYIPGTSRNFYINGGVNISTGTASANWTSTLYLKRVDGKPITSVGSYLYVSGNVNDNVMIPTEPVEDGWVRVTRSRIGLTSAHVTLVGCYGLEPAEYLIAEWKVEPRAHATSFAEGATASSQLYLDALGGYMNYTITGTFTPRQPFMNNGAYVESARSGARLFTIWDRGIAGHISYQYWENSSGTSGPYLNRSGNYGTGNIHQYYTLERHKPAFFSIVKDGAAFSFRIYQDGWKTSHSTSVNATARLDDLRFGDSTMWNGIYKNIAIYNRALSDQEVEKELARSFSVKPDGGVSTRVSENPYRKEDGIRFPLAHSLESQGGVVQPVTARNEAYEDGALWVGNTTVNQHPLPWAGFVSASHMTATTINFPNPVIPGGQVRKFYHPIEESRISDQRVFTDVTPLIDKTKTYTYSVWVYIPSGQQFQAQGTWRALQSPDTSSWTGTLIQTAEKGLDNNLVDTWQRIWVTFKANEADAASYFYIHYYNRVSAESCFYTTGGQLEEGAFPSAFTESIRGHSELVLPYNIIDCKQDFTVFGWFMPRLMADGVYRPFLTRNRIASNVTSQRLLLMPSGTTNRTLRLWFGSGGSETSVTVPSTMNILDNEWNFFCFKRTGTTVKLFHGVKGNIGSAESTNGAFLNTDEDAATWGWLIGKYSSVTSMGNGFAKDYNFIQRALTDAEVENIFRSQMKSHKDGVLQIQNQIREGRVL